MEIRAVEESCPEQGTVAGFAKTVMKFLAS
jgi:hypothetical protein